jgi:adenine specific DNA methylase Mod
MPESLLMRIIAVSSNQGDCVIDPFIGSGTTATAALKLQRNYLGIEISKDYAEKAKQRLAQMKKIKINEIYEIKRLIPDIGYSAKQIITDKKLLEVFAGQLTIRMNGQKKYSTAEVTTALKGLAHR